MRFKEALLSVPLQSAGLNNNQLRRGSPNQQSTEELENRNENNQTTITNTGNRNTRSSSPIGYNSEEIEDFRVAEDTTTWSSLAITRDNVQLTSNQDASNINNNNNNLTTTRIRRNSSVESLADYEGRNSSHEDSSHELTPSDWSDWSEDGNLRAGCRGIVNPNYPGFQHLAPSLLSDTDLTEDESCADYPAPNEETNPINGNEYNNNVDDNINHLGRQSSDRKIFYEKSKFNIQTVTSLYEAPVPPAEKCINYVKSVEDSRTEGKVTITEHTVDADIEIHHTIAESEKIEEASDFSKTVVPHQPEIEIPVEIEVVEVTTSVKESLQFPEIEKIADSGKNSEIGESSGYESVVPPTEKSLNPTNSEEDSKSEEKFEAPRSELVENESSSRLTVFESEQTVLDNSEQTVDFAQPTEINEKLQIEELNTKIHEELEFQSTEDTSNAGETEDTKEIAVKHIDLIREAKELPQQGRAKIGNHQAIRSAGTADDNSSNNSDSDSCPEDQPTYTKLEEIDLLSSIGRDIGVDLEKYVQPVPDVVAMETIDHIHNSSRVSMMKDSLEGMNKLIDRDLPEASSTDVRKKEKMVRNQAKRRQQQQQQQMRTSSAQKRPDKRRADTDNGPGGFDVYNIETAMPKIDLDAIESHLRAAREEERRRRNDREEIRRRLAMGPDAEDLRVERGRKPSLQSRLQSGMNLQICFMNETTSDTESPCSENDASPGLTPTSLTSKHHLQNQQQLKQQQVAARPQMLGLPPLRLDTGMNSAPIDEADFFARQARLQTEARMALAQAKEMAHMQMEVERQRLKQSPITEMVRSSLEKVGVQLGADRRRLSRMLLTDLNVAQLQVVANDLHARIASLNEALVEGLLRRDDLHMEQDSMLVDVEDLTRYLGAKQESLKKKQNSREQQSQQQQPGSRGQQQVNNNVPSKSSLKPKLTHRGLVALVRK